MSSAVRVSGSEFGLAARCAVVGGLGRLEKRILLELLSDIGGELEVGQLQQLDRLLQLRRHDQGLALAQIETK